ncbi:MAG: hypothetical protein J5I47_01900 [Vicingus serpentipes]|nr:hypothetical protein [Vicingus serpentipes]
MLTITLTKQEAKEVLYKAPEGFRFAKADDFHNNGVRKESVQIFILQSSDTTKLLEYHFGNHTSRNWLQWLMDQERVFIKTGDRAAEQSKFNHFIVPTEQYLINEINKGRA